MGVDAEKKRAADGVLGSIKANRLGDRENVGFVERAIKRRAAMTGRAKRHPLRRDGRVWLRTKIRSDEPRHIDQHSNWRRFSGEGTRLHDVSFEDSLFPLGLILRTLLRLGLHWSGERRRLACCPRRPAESGSDGSGETPKPTRGTRVLPGPRTSISAMPRGLSRGCLPSLAAFARRRRWRSAPLKRAARKVSTNSHAVAWPTTSPPRRMMLRSSSSTPWY